jgi:hypothetical protein
LCGEACHVVSDQTHLQDTGIARWCGSGVAHIDGNAGTAPCSVIGRSFLDLLSEQFLYTRRGEHTLAVALESCLVGAFNAGKNGGF